MIVVFGGVVALQRWAGPDTTTISPQSVETWGDWYEWAVAGGELNGRVPVILQGGLGPEAQFDPNGLGIEQALEPVSHSALSGDRSVIARDQGDMELLRNLCGVPSTDHSYDVGSPRREWSAGGDGCGAIARERSWRAIG